MEQGLKQRLVGALVLVSLAVIFLPLVFDGQQQRIDVSQYEIPEKPAITLSSVEIDPVVEEAQRELAALDEIRDQKRVQDEEGATTESSSASDATDPAISQPRNETSEAQSIPVDPSIAAVKAHTEAERQVDQGLKGAPVTQTVPLAETWIIQVGAFSSQSNADGLRGRLKAGGYSAFVKPVNMQSGTLYKVYVGPEIRRYRLDQQKIELEQKYKLKALILKYIP